MNIEKVLTLIGDYTGRSPKKGPSGYSCICPSHNDHAPSLFVKEREDGSIGLFCFAGCKFREICDSIGVDPVNFSSIKEETEEERRARKLRIQKEAKEREIKYKSMLEIWDKASPSDHPYLKKKKVEAFNTRVYQDKLLVPIFSPGGSIISFQAIDESGDKKNAPGCSTSGFLPLGERTKDSRVIIAEGFATAATIQMAFKEDQVVVAFGLSKIKSVYNFYKEFTDNEVLIAGDVGADHGDLYTIYPKSEEKGYDFNDLYIDKGLDSVKEALKKSFYRARSLEEVLDNPPPPVNWIFENFLHTDSLNVIFARHGEGKTRFVYELIYHAACGIQFLDYPCHGPRSVLIIDGEMSRSEFFDYLKNITQRVRDKQGNLYLPKKDFNSIFQEDIEKDKMDYINLNDSVSRKSLEKLVQAHDIIVLDNLLALSVDSGTPHYGGRDKEVKGMIRWIGQLKRAGKTIIMIAHANKEGEVYGSNTMLSADAQSIIKIEATESGGFKVFFNKHRRVMPQHKKPFKMEYSTYGKYTGGWDKSIIEPLQKVKQSKY